MSPTYCPTCRRTYSTQRGACPRCPPPPPPTEPGRCPRCWRPLLVRVANGATIDACARCRGVWFDTNELQRVMDLRVGPRPTSTSGATSRVPAAADVAVDATLQVGCVRCHQRMARVEAAPGAGVWVHSCARHGLWFDGPDLPRFRAFVARGGLAGVPKGDPLRAERIAARRDAARGTESSFGAVGTALDVVWNVLWFWA